MIDQLKIFREEIDFLYDHHTNRTHWEKLQFFAVKVGHS